MSSVADSDFRSNTEHRRLSPIDRTQPYSRSPQLRPTESGYWLSLPCGDSEAVFEFEDLERNNAKGLAATVTTWLKERRFRVRFDLAETSYRRHLKALKAFDGWIEAFNLACQLVIDAVATGTVAAAKEERVLARLHVRPGSVTAEEHILARLRVRPRSVEQLGTATFLDNRSVRANLMRLKAKGLVEPTGIRADDNSQVWQLLAPGVEVTA